MEQTTSKCLPLYLMRKSSALVESTLRENERIDAMLKAGITRLFSMQTASGGLGYWPGSSAPNRYGSVYALHFLALVQRDRELPLPQENLKQLQSYVRLVANETSDSSDSGLYLRAYAHYVLAINGDAEALKQIDRFNALDMPLSARYLLAAALAMNTSDADRVKKLLAMPAHDYKDKETSGTLNSEIRDDAVKLLMLVQMHADEKQCGPLVDSLTRYLDKSHYYITQDGAFVCAALGSYLNQFSEKLDEAEATVTSPEGEKQLKHGDHAVLRHQGAKGRFTVANTGKAAIFVNFATSGVPLKPVENAESEGLKIARSVQTAKHEAIAEGTAYAQGDTFVIQLNIESENELDNVVLVDLLPAGFEIENPRLDEGQAAKSDASSEGEGETESGGDGDSSEDGDGDSEGGSAPRKTKDGILLTDEAGSSETPSYLDVRDDRLVLAFNKLPAGAHTYYYLVRAVTPGTYQQPGAAAECMYDPKVRANTAPAAVEVK